MIENYTDGNFNGGVAGSAALRDEAVIKAITGPDGTKHTIIRNVAILRDGVLHTDDREFNFDRTNIYGDEVPILYSRFVDPSTTIPERLIFIVSPNGTVSKVDLGTSTEEDIFHTTQAGITYTSIVKRTSNTVNVRSVRHYGQIPLVIDRVPPNFLKRIALRVRDWGKGRPVEP